MGPNIALSEEGLAYAQAECELIARARGLTPLDLTEVPD